MDVLRNTYLVIASILGVVLMGCRAPKPCSAPNLVTCQLASRTAMSAESVSPGQQRIPQAVALEDGLALVPLILTGEIPGQEIEYPMGLVILFGLITATLVNLILLPAICTFPSIARIIKQPVRNEYVQDPINTHTKEVSTDH